MALPGGIQGVLFIGATRDAGWPNRFVAIKLILRAKRRWDRGKEVETDGERGGPHKGERERERRGEEKRRRLEEEKEGEPRLNPILLAPSFIPDHRRFFYAPLFIHTRVCTRAFDT